MRRKDLKLNIRRITAFILVFVFIVCLAPSIYADGVGGDCGEGVKWSLEGGTLVISGNGAMSDYGEFSPAPWADYADGIFSLRVEEGVTHIGSFAFFNLKYLGAANISGSVEKIGGWAFYGCSSLSILELGSGIKEIGESAFELCVSLPTVRIPDSVTTIRSEAFFRCEGLMNVTVPSSVTFMEPMVFTYCSSLKSARILADIPELPYWTFYGCYELVSVSLSASISDLGVQAFESCDLLTTVSHGGSADISQKLPHTVTDFNSDADLSVGIPGDYNSSFTDENGNNVTVSGSFTESENGFISTEVTHTKGNGTNSAGVKIEAVVEDPEAWNELHKEMVNAMQDREYSAEKEMMDVTVHLKGEPEITGDVLSLFAGKDVEVSVHTSQGAVWQFNGTGISAKELSESYKLSYTLTTIDDPNEEQLGIIGSNGYLLMFDEDLDVKVEVHLPLGEELARDTAVFFSPEKEGYTRMQASVIDGRGIAHFYLAKVKAGIEYLIGINIPNRDASPGAPSDVIVPDELKDEYPDFEQIEPIEYVITGRKSSWGISANQVGLILVGVMIVSIVVVGVIVYISFKAKRKNGYDPVLDGEVAAVKTKDKPLNKKTKTIKKK